MEIGPICLNIEKRVIFNAYDAARIAILSVILALIAFGVFMGVEGIDPLAGYRQMFSYALGTTWGIELTLRRTTFMVLVTLAFLLPHRAGIWNIGAPAQVYMGMIAAVGIGFGGKGLGPGVLLLMMLGAMLGGGVLGAIVGYLRACMKVNEIVVALMLNSIMFYVVKYLIEGPWMDPSGRPESAKLHMSARLPMIPGTTIPVTILIAVVLAVLLYFFLSRTTIGYEIRVTGANPMSARYAGISIIKIAAITMFVGGAIAGIAGVHQTAGISGVYRIHRYFATFPGTWAYYGIVFGLISTSNPLAAILVCFFFSAMQVGTKALQMRLGMGFGADLVFVGILMLFLVAGQYLYHKRVVWSFERNRDGRKRR